MSSEQTSSLRLILSESFSIYLALSEISHSSSISSNKKTQKKSANNFKSYLGVWRELMEIKAHFTCTMTKMQLATNKISEETA